MLKNVINAITEYNQDGEVFGRVNDVINIFQFDNYKFKVLDNVPAGEFYSKWAPKREPKMGPIFEPILGPSRCPGLARPRRAGGMRWGPGREFNRYLTDLDRLRKTSWTKESQHGAQAKAGERPNRERRAADKWPPPKTVSEEAGNVEGGCWGGWSRDTAHSGSASSLAACPQQRPPLSITSARQAVPPSC